MKQKRSGYADVRRGAQGISLAPGYQVLVKQRKGNKLSTIFEDTPYKVTNKYGNEFTVRLEDQVIRKLDHAK